jgi:hypothetical protein
MTPRPITTLILAACALGALAGCREERIVSRRGMLSSLPGAQTQIPDERTTVRPDVLRTPSSGIREVREDDTVVLHAKTVQHLMSHVVSTIQNDEKDLFVEQVLARRTRDEFRIRGYDPGVAFDEVVRRQRDVFKLFNAMPFGENTPGIYLQTIGRNEFRMQVPRSGRADLKWTGFDVVFEEGNYRLRWFLGD